MTREALLHLIGLSPNIPYSVPKADIDLVILALVSLSMLYIVLPSYCLYQPQSNLDGSNTDGSFTMANSNSFLSPYEILPIAQENKYLMKFSYFIGKLYVVCTH